MIRINWKDIKEDVDKQTWRLAQVHIAELEKQDYAQEDESKASMKYIMRYAENGIALVRNAIKEELLITSSDVSDDALDMEKEGWTFTFKDSTNVDEESLAMLIHNFVVNHILYRWASTWAKDAVQGFKSMCSDGMDELKGAAVSLNEPTKTKRLKPDTGYNVSVEYGE